jgi:hypothetical protein
MNDVFGLIYEMLKDCNDIKLLGLLSSISKHYNTLVKNIIYDNNKSIAYGNETFKTYIDFTKIIEHYDIIKMDIEMFMSCEIYSKYFYADGLCSNDDAVDSFIDYIKESMIRVLIISDVNLKGYDKIVLGETLECLCLYNCRLSKHIGFKDTIKEIIIVRDDDEGIIDYEIRTDHSLTKLADSKYINKKLWFY